MFTTLTPTKEGYTKKLQDSSKATCWYMRAGDFRISFSTAIRRPKSNLSRCRSAMFGSLCAAVNISNDSSYARNILAVLNRNTRRRPSSQSAAKRFPSGLTASAIAKVWFFRKSYKCVSLLNEKRRRPGRVSSVGICRVSGSHNSREPDLSALMQAWRCGLYRMTCAGCEWTSRVLAGVGSPVSGRMTCTEPDSAAETANNGSGELAR
mmetsp:Transcript_1372/g.2880  ORF Transcript_1372/g.2880 Transcript_1372/m.2880 type:complete len:208 (+) Transcript_1372:882-1505(+)